MICPCGSVFFAASGIWQTNEDGRAMLLATDAIHHQWVTQLVCVSCHGKFFIFEHNKNKDGLVPAGSARATQLFEKYKIDFSQSMDPRQHKPEEAKV